MTVEWGAVQHSATGAMIFATNFALVVGLAAVGAAVTERAGVLNLAQEGLMLLGAAVGFSVAVHAGSNWLGLAGGAVAGLGLGVIKALWSVTLKTEQVINGLLLVPVGVGLSNLLYKHQFAALPVPPRVTPTDSLPVPLLHELPVLGPVLFDRSPLAYVAVVLVAVVAYVLGHTRAGLGLRVAGESPETLHFNGLGVDRYRFVAVLIGAAMTGFAGALLAVDQLHLFHPAMTAGRGWIAIAVVIVAGRRPWMCLLVALLFGMTDMLQFQFQIQLTSVPYELLLSLPYLATVFVLAVGRAGARTPAALGIPYTR